MQNVSSLLMARVTAKNTIVCAPQEVHSEASRGGSRYTIDTYYAAQEPGESIGGDWYDVFQLPDGRVAVTIGDVEGSNRLAARTMRVLQQVMRNVGTVHPEPNAMLAAADVTLRTTEPELIATAIAGVIDFARNKFTFASAGHPNPLLLHADGSFEESHRVGLPLGLRTYVEPESIDITLPTGATMILYTDGLVESTRSLDEGRRRLHETLSDGSVHSRRWFAREIFRRVLFDGVFDDVAIVTIRMK